MPTMQAMTSRANVRFGLDPVDGIAGINPEDLAPGVNLAAKAHTPLGIATTSAEQGYLASFPPGHLEALRAILYHAVTQDPRLPVTFAWTPAYAHGIGFWEVAGTPQSRGGITVLVRSPLPSEAA